MYMYLIAKPPCSYNLWSIGQGVYDALEADSYFNLVRWQEVEDSPKSTKIKKYYKTLKLEARSKLILIVIYQHCFKLMGNTIGQL